MKPMLVWYCSVLVLALALPGFVASQKIIHHPAATNVITAGASSPHISTCPKDKMFTSCVTPCPITCDNHLNPSVCEFLYCIPGCTCLHGLVEHHGHCIDPSLCPTAAPSTDDDTFMTTHPVVVPPVCTNGQVYMDCGSLCPITCQNINEPPICAAMCVSGCFCPSGLIDSLGTCVQECPGSTMPLRDTTVVPVTMATTSCPSGMEYRKCGPICRRTCFSLLDSCFSLRCSSGCFCPNKQMEHEGACVDECPGSTEPRLTTAVVPVTMATPSCPSGMEYRKCGPICRRTCFLLLNSCFSLRCAPGCFCPDKLTEHEGACVEECPGSTEPLPTTAVVPITMATPCPSGMEYRKCGPICRRTCFSVLDSCFSLRCAPGCFCPDKLMEHEGACVTECPVINYATSSTSPPITASLPVGTSYPRDPCAVVRCASNLHCRHDRVSGATDCVPYCQINNGGCRVDQICTIAIGGCDTTTSNTPCDPVPLVNCIDTRQNPCAAMTCLSPYKCVASNITGKGRCVPDCKMDNGGCSDDKICEILTVGCSSSSSAPCDFDFYRHCKDPPYVPCQWEAYLACDSEWTYCLEQNKTKRATCVGSCLSNNGGCNDDSVCITTFSRDRFDLQCVDYDDLPSDCPAGKTLVECGSNCQETCETHLHGDSILCSLECVQTCVCPFGLVLFRDRCVDPRLCYTLMTYPPQINPLPILDPNTILLSMNSLGMTTQEFEEEKQQLLMHSIQSTLTLNGISKVVAKLHGMYYDKPQLMITVELSGDDVCKDSSQSFADILNQNSHSLGINIQNVQPEKVMYIDFMDTPSRGQGLARNAVIGIAVVGAVLALVLVMMLTLVLVAYYVGMRRRSGTKGQLRVPTVVSMEPSVATNVEIPDKVDFADIEKVKLIKESLVY